MLLFVGVLPGCVMLVFDVGYMCAIVVYSLFRHSFMRVATRLLEVCGQLFAANVFASVHGACCPPRVLYAAGCCLYVVVLLTCVVSCCDGV